MKSQLPYWWWFDSHHSPKRSPWLQSALAELAQRTQAIVQVLEEDGDSFAQRAEMYYKRRPQLISMIEDFYRTQRSLLAQYEQLKADSGMRNHLQTNLASPFSFSTKIQQENMHSETSSEIDLKLEYSTESEVDDPEQEDEVLDNYEIMKEGILGMIDNIEVRKLKEEIERLRVENRLQKEQLIQKDEEKKEVIRQLSLTVIMLKDDIARLRSARNGTEFTDKRNLFDFGGTFLRMLHGSRTFKG